MEVRRKLRITVVGTGYVGLSLAVLLAGRHSVTALDVLPEKITMINNRMSPIQDMGISEFLRERRLDLKATLNSKEAYGNAEYIIVAVPTNYDSQRDFFDTSAVETVIEEALSVNSEAVIVIKSTIPVGYTEHICRKKNTGRILFSPSFCGNRRRCMIICILPELLSDMMRKSLLCVSMQKHLPECCVNVLKKGCAETYHGTYRSGGGEIICKYVSGSAD